MKLTDGEAQRALDEVDGALAEVHKELQHELEGVQDGGENALEDLDDGLEEVSDSCCDTHDD